MNSTSPKEVLRHRENGAGIAFRVSISHAQVGFFHNNGDGTFTDVSKESGIAKLWGKAWGGRTDLNNDGQLDLLLSNDTVPNFFRNRGKAAF